MKVFIIGISACFLINIAAVGQQAATANIQYSLFKPVPRDKLRSMKTDRPDATESPVTVDAGHFQLETDLFKHVYNRAWGIKTTQYIFNSANLKAGLTNSTDLQLITDSYVVTSTSLPLSRADASVADVTIRLKQNLFGNNDGNVALGLLAYKVLPTNSTVEGRETGIIIPLSFALRNGLSIGTQVQAARVQLYAGSYETTFMNSLSFGKGLGEKLSTFVEGFYTYGSAGKALRFTFDSGIVFAVSKNMTIDAGFNLGLMKDTDRAYYTGFSFRY